MIPLPLIIAFHSIRDAAIKAATVAAKIANAVPGWIWACALILVLVQACSQRSALADLREVHADLVTAVEAQKSQASAELQAAHARVNTLQEYLANSTKTKDASDVKTIFQINDLAAELRNARIDGRLRDPNASGQGSASACTDAASRSATGEPNAADAAGLLSEPLTDLLLDSARQADNINAAYARCRADARELRQAYDAWRKALPVSE